MKTNKIALGILAHVDAGKTTLSESLLYLSGSIRKLGRVDHKDAFLDTYELERARGITIFSKQALLTLGDTQVTLLDTPGHVDFSAEMERTLQVLDYGILVINGADGVQGHTLTLWKLLKRYHLPVFLFVNKMDQVGTDRSHLLQELENRLDERCLDFGSDLTDSDFLDKLAMCDEVLMERYLETGHIPQQDIVSAIDQRKVFPVYFGSALKVEGVQEFIQGLETYLSHPTYPEAFGAKVFKINRDPQGNRLTFMKITGGLLKVKDLLSNEKFGVLQDQQINNVDSWKEKVDQIRLYSGTSFQAVNQVEAGTICAVTGLTRTQVGEGLGIEPHSDKPMLKPVLTYKIELPVGCDVHQMFLKLRQLEEEDPHLNIVWDEKLSEIHAQVMGEIEIEILKSRILERFQVAVTFGAGSLVYKETIQSSVEGIGHFEPLRHYAEVHLLMEPGEMGSGLILETNCSEDLLDRSWQRLVVSHLEEKIHKGVLTGSAITDIKITLVAGRAHQKHTEGGDFRQATYRAVRQGLKKAKSVLLEPVYEFQLELPKELVGRAMSDISKMQGNFTEPIIEGDYAILSGSAPVATMRDYSMEVIAYSRGMGKLFVALKGYEPCHNAEEVIEAVGYDSEADVENPTSSVFCSHGAGFVVPWDQVSDYKHVESGINLEQEEEVENIEVPINRPMTSYEDGGSLSQDKELEDIFYKTYGASKRDSSPGYRRALDSVKEPTYTKEQRGQQANESVEMKREQTYVSSPNKVVLDKYLLVDGYNIIFAWDNLKALAKVNLDAARMQLQDVLCNYQSYKNETVIVVFDAYKVAGNRGDLSMYHNIHVVFTKEAETADQYIEKLVHSIGRKYDVTVATSDALEQVIILSKGARRLSALGLQAEVEAVSDEIRSRFLNKETRTLNYPFKKLEEK